MRDMERYKGLTDEQKRTMQLFTEAQGRLGVGFDRLGQRISVMVAEHLTPMMNKFSEFVEQNTPQIETSLTEIGDAFGELWKSIAGETTGQQAIKTLTDNIKSLVDDLKWLVDKGNDLAAILNRLSNIHSWRDLTTPIITPSEGGTQEGYAKEPLGPPPPGKKEDTGPGFLDRHPALGRGWGSFGEGLGFAPMAYHPGAVGAVAGPQPLEFWLDMSRAVAKGFEDAFDHITGIAAGGAMMGGAAPGVVPASFTPNDRGGGGGAAGGGVSGGGPGGLGGIAAPAGTPIATTGLATVTSASGRKYQVDARFAPNFQGFINDYEKAGGQLGPDTGTVGSRPNNASGHPIGAAIDINQIGRGVRSQRGVTLDPRLEDELARRWGFVSGNSWRSNDQGHFGIESVEAARRALEAARARAPAVTMPGARPVNGSVDVNITHKNPPPNSAVTATGSGAVNVAPPRVEHQDMTSI